MNEKELLDQAFVLINSYVADYPPCICGDEYKGRGLVAPNCQHCDDIDFYNDLVAWLDRWYESAAKTERSSDENNC
jgi:hypothetical protein